MKFIEHNSWLLTLLLVASIALPSCLQAPNYDDVPSIDFASITATRISKVTGVYDTVEVELNWRDGDGDLGLGKLGLDNTDIEPPFNRNNPDGSPNLYYDNYFVQLQVRRGTAEFKDTIIGSATGYNGRFFRLSNTDRPEALRGELRRGFKFFQGTFPANTEVRFKIYVLDRELNQSNTVITEPFLFID